MTRSSSWLLLFTLALAGAAEARQVCSTLTVDQRGTRTYTAEDETITIVKTRKPCISTVSTVTTPKPKTVTSNVPVYTTVTIDGIQQTDLFISTRTSFVYESPTTTLTADTTPTVTETSTLDAATTITSYTLADPTATPNAGRRGLEERDTEKTDGKMILARQARRGRDVYCHEETTITSTQAKQPCSTTTKTSTAPRKTITTKVPLTVTVTKAKAPPKATKTVYISKKLTITADLATAYTTNTFTTTQTVDAPSETAIVGGYSRCNPENFNFVTDYNVEGTFYTILSDISRADCCKTAITTKLGAYLVYREASGRCEIYSAAPQDGCPIDIAYNLGTYGVSPRGYWGLMLQCGVQGGEV